MTAIRTRNKITSVIILILFMGVIFTMPALAEVEENPPRSKPLCITLTGASASPKINLKMINISTNEEFSFEFLVGNNYMVEYDLPDGTYMITNATTNRRNYEISFPQEPIQVNFDAEYITIKITEKDLSMTFGYFLRNNAFLLLGLLGCCAAYAIIKKRQADALQRDDDSRRER